MTESEWLACTDAVAMLRFLGKKASQRKLRLLACACCRRVWHAPTHPTTHFAVELAERFADESVDVAALAQASATAAWVVESSDIDGTGSPLDRGEPGRRAGSAASYAASPGLLKIDHLRVALRYAAQAAKDGAVQETAAQAGLVRDLFDSLVWPIAFDPTWRTATVVALAQGAYDDRLLPRGELDLDRLGVLADALEDAGCDGATLLGHLRSSGPHVRGCWALDLLLGEE